MAAITIDDHLLSKLQAAAERNKMTLEAQLADWLVGNHQSETKLQQSQLRMQALFDHALDAIMLADDEGNYIDANPAACQKLGYSRDELLQLSLRDLVAPGYANEALGTWDKFIQYGQLHGEITLQCKDGQLIEVDYRAVAHILPGVNLSILRDITQRKANEQAIHESEQRFRAMFDNQLMGIVVAKPSGEILAANAAACELLGRSEAELIQIGRAGVLDESEPAVQAMIKERRETGQFVGELHMIHANGTRIPVTMTSTVFWVSDEEHVMVSIQDMRAQKKATQHLEQSELRFRTLFDNAPVGIFVVDGQGIIRQMNQQAERIFGYTADELLGERVEILVPANVRHQHSNYRDNFFHQPRSRPMGLDLEIFGVRKDGTQIPIEIALGHWRTETENFVLTFISDMTERRQAEEARRTAQLLRVELVKERELRDLKSQFLTMVAHQFRTPLTVILTSNELIRHYGVVVDKQLTHLDKIETQVRRLEKMVEDVSMVSKNELRNHDLKLSYYDLSSFLQKIIDETLLTYQKEVAVELQDDLECRRVAFDGRLMDEIMTNLISNAVKYTPNGGSVTIHCICDDDHVVVLVKDTGIGIPKADQPHLYSPFFRARNIDEAPGTGLGLAIVKQAVDAYGGEIRFESRENEGTSFEVRFPRRLPVT